MMLETMKTILSFLTGPVVPHLSKGFFLLLEVAQKRCILLVVAQLSFVELINE